MAHQRTRQMTLTIVAALLAVALLATSALAMLDTNVVLNHLLKREPWASDATAIWRAHGAGDFGAFVSTITPVNVFRLRARSR